MKQLVQLAAGLLLVMSNEMSGGVQPRPGAKVLPVGPPEAEPRADMVTDVQSISPALYAIGPGDSIGFTVSDYATNRSACHNIINFGDGTLAIGRMAAEISDATDRGTYYSYSADAGGTWTPLSWVEGTRQGWGNIEQFVDAAGTEVTVSHTGMQVCVDAAKGANVWSCASSGVATDLWARSAVTSPFYVHMVTGDANPPTTIWYTRTADAGSTFDIVDQPIFTLPGFRATFDAYDMAAHGSTVAIVNAPEGYFGSLDTDVLLALSTDHGTTWTEQVLQDQSGPGELPTGMTEYMSDGTVAAVFDNDGNLHVVWCTFLAIGNTSNNPELFYQIDAPLMYWSEATGVVEIATTVHDTSIVKPGNQFGNLVTQPDIAVDASNNIYIIYQQQISEQDTAGVYLQHIFATGSSDGGFTWREPIDITPGTGFDASFGSMADLVDDNIHLTYFSDPLGGNAIRANHAVIPVAVMYLAYPSLDLITGTKENAGQVPAAYRLDQNYPNPFNPATNIRYSIPLKSFVTLRVYDILGRLVSSLVDGEQEAGSYAVDFDAVDLAGGTYFYTLEARAVDNGRTGEYAQTRKMVLVK